MITMLNMDCMKYLATLSDKAFELAIVDPPYGIGKDAMHQGRLKKGSGKLKNICLQRMDTAWEETPPPPEYFDELRRVSVNQIIWGGNYFPLPPTRGIIVWDKMQPWENFSQVELAWSSFDKPAALYQQNNSFTQPSKIHPTQKPVALYKWLLSRYAKPGDKILDTHGGSGSHCIAAHDLGFDLVWMEKDKDYFDAAVARYKLHASQGQLFQPAPAPIKNIELDF